MSAVNPRVGTPGGGGHRNRGGKGSNQHPHQQPGLIRENHTSHGGTRARDGGKGDHRTAARERERRQEQNILFQRIDSRAALSDDPEQLRKHFVSLENELRQWSKRLNHVDTADKTVEKWDRILPHIDEFMSTATKLYSYDTVYYVATEVDVRVWKYGVYQFITVLRGVSPESSKKNAAFLAINQLCQKGIHHFKYFLINAGKQLKVPLEQIFSSSGFLRSSARKEELNEKENLCYRLFIQLGDLYRYLFERSRNHRDAYMASTMYKAARFCDTTKSRAYYQLALMSKIQGDVVGTIHNYTRALCTEPAIDGINGQLRFIYDDIYKQFNSVKSTYWFTLMKTTEKNYPFIRPTKLEKWMLPIPSMEKCVHPAKTLPPSKLEHFTSLSDTEVFQRFGLAYSHFIGMLFTNIGTETIEDAGKEVIIYFEGLLIKNSIDFDFILEMFGLILFMTDYLEPPPEIKGDLASQGAASQIKYMREVAIDVTINMLIMVCEKLLRAVKLFDWDGPLLTLCSAVLHVWCRWAKRRAYICSDIKKERKLFESNPKKYERNQMNKKFNMGKFVMSYCRLHTEIAPLLQKHTSMIFPEISIGTTETCQTPMGSLPEHVVLDGFGDVLKPPDFDLSKFYHDGKFNQTRLLVHFRLARIVSFGCTMFPDLKQSKLYSSQRNWESVQHPIDIYIENEFQVTNWVHEIQKKPIRSEISSGKQVYKVKYRRPDCNNARVLIKDPPKCTWDPRELRLSKFKTPPITKAYEIWQDLQVKGVRVELYIRPIHIVLDTNTFIHNLHWIKHLMSLIKNPIIVPSAVLSELRGLARGVKNGYSPKPTHKKNLTREEKLNRSIEAMEIGEQCATALQLLNENKKHFRVVTIGGKEVKMYNYMKQKVFDEWVNPGSRNDEKIMETCAYLELKDKEARRKETPTRILRNFVLLTGDRALRVRSFAQDIPARDIESFIQWYQDSLDDRIKASPRKHRSPRFHHKTK